MAQSAIKSYQKKITPAEAQEYLSNLNHEHNRKISIQHVSFLLGEMEDGNWIVTGDPIQFNRDGELINGQHRLTALVKYGKPLEMFIAKNVPNEAFKVLDTGRTRTGGDTLRIAGHKAAYTMASACRTILLYRSGRFDLRAGRNKGISNTQILAFADENKKQLENIIHEAYHVYQKFGFASSPSMLAALLYFFKKKDSQRTEEFFMKYSTGAELSIQSPIRLLREELMKNKAGRRSLYNERDVLALHILAWNAFKEGKKITKLVLEKDYEFPKIK